MVKSGAGDHLTGPLAALGIGLTVSVRLAVGAAIPSVHGPSGNGQVPSLYDIRQDLDAVRPLRS